ncbi:MAG: outer membrane beta-barrel protein [Candidatus Aminicenantes bacterium]|nr:outer membrane beta-barrel protein [Candidatus Aminicenantes bacterium]
MKKVFIAMAALALAVLPAAGAGQQNISIGIRFGLALDASKYDALPFELENDLGATYGLWLGIRQGHIGAEVGYFHAERSLTPKAEAPPELEATTFRLNSFSFNLLYYPFLSSTLQPYVTGGYGYYRVNFVDYDEDRSSGFNLGAGLDLLLFPKLSMALEARYQWVTFTFAESPLDSQTWTATFGLNYHF